LSNAHPDECVDPRIKRLFADHEIATVHEKKWDTQQMPNAGGRFFLAANERGWTLIKPSYPRSSAFIRGLIALLQRHGEVHHVGKPPFREPNN
jgi:hypothetical protein